MNALVGEEIKAIPGRRARFLGILGRCGPIGGGFAAKGRPAAESEGRRGEKGGQLGETGGLGPLGLDHRSYCSNWTLVTGASALSAGISMLARQSDRRKRRRAASKSRTS